MITASTTTTLNINDHVPDLARRPLCPPVELPFYDEPRTNPGSQGDVDEIPQVFSCAELQFRQSTYIYIIVEEYGKSQFGMSIVLLSEAER